MNNLFKELFEYNYNVNQKLSDAFTDNSDKISEKAIKLFNHILNAHQIWNNRIDPKQTTFGVWELHPIEELKRIDHVNYEQSTKILEHLDLNEKINYFNSNGQAFSKYSRDIIFHIINHSSYHRGQIAAEFRQCGLDPLVSDYIWYK